MTTIFIIIGLLAMFHLFYESVILPTIRMSLRYRLFALRDKLRMIQILRSGGLNDSVFRIVEDNINNAIALLPQITVSHLISANQIFEQNQKLKNSVDARVKKVETCEIDEIRAIAKEVTSHITTCFVWNAGGWLIYLFPVFVILFFYNAIKEISQELVFVKDEKALGIKNYPSELATI